MEYTGIVILNYNNYEDTFNCIDSIEKHNSSQIKFFIVDNASTRDGVVNSLDSYFHAKYEGRYLKLGNGDCYNGDYPYLTFIISDINGGYAQGNNLGLKQAFNDPQISNIMILNNDVLFVEDIIPGLIEKVKILPQCGIISPILYKKNFEGLDYNCGRSAMTFRHAILQNLTMGKPWFGIKQKIDDEQYILKQIPEAISKEYVEIDYPSGSCMFASIQLWKEIDGFDPNTFLFYEEAILFSKTQRIRKQNYLIPSLKCIHLGASSTSKSTSPKQTKLAFQSKKYYMLNYFNSNFFQKIILRITLFLDQIALFVKFDVLGFSNSSKK